MHKQIEQLINPRAKTGFIFKYLFMWVYPILRLGNKRELQLNDLYKVLPEDESEKLGNMLQREWIKELANNVNKKNPSLTRALLRTFGIRYIFLGLIPLLNECVFRIVQPLCLGKLIDYFYENSDMSVESAYIYATGVVLGSSLPTLLVHPYFHECLHLGLQIRTALCSLIYTKSLKLNHQALTQTNVGQVVNLMSNDAGRFDEALCYLHYFIVGPLQAIITAIILYFLAVGPSCLVGMSVLILFIPFQGWMGRVFSELRLKTAKRTDERIQIMNEVLTGIRVIKMYSWGKPFDKLIYFCRRMEVKVIRKTAIYRGINESLYFTSAKLIIFFTFITYVLTNNALTSETVFLVVALFNNMRLGITWFFPMAITSAAECLVSIQRIENLLLLDEMKNNEFESSDGERPHSSACNIECQKVTAKWPAQIAESSLLEDSDYTLRDISFDIGPAQVLAIVGQVGSGKVKYQEEMLKPHRVTALGSSLLNIILRELIPLSGKIQIKGKIAYASQEPWIFSASIRKNILCGLHYDARRYKKVIKASALQTDFTTLPQGDQTIVGERGISLSGGQKARINLARCLYVDADIYLLDDPLSAVDTQVGRHLFDNAINGFLKDKIRILVTHQLQYLVDVDQILALKGGKVEALGNFRDFLDKGHDLTKTLGDGEGKDLNKEDHFEDDSTTTTLSKRRRSTLKSSLHKTRSSSIVSKTSSSETLEEEEDLNKEKHFEDDFTTSLERRSTLKSSLHKTRSSSIVSKASSNENKNDSEEEALLMEEEYRSKGRVNKAVYIKYFRSGGGCISFTFLLFSFVMTQVLFSLSDYWLNIWTNAEQIRAGSNSTINPSNNSTLPWQEEVDTNTGIMVYAILIGSFFLASMIRSILFFIRCMFSSIKLHNQMFQAIIRAPMLFFERNSAGRILNRFTKDIGTMDNQLPIYFFYVLSIFLNVLGVIAVIAVVNLWFLLPMVFLSFLFYKLRVTYLKAGRALKRLEATSKSPIFTHLSSSLTGLTTLRAHHCSTIFEETFHQLQDIHSSVCYLYISTPRWLGVTVDWASVFYVACVTYICTALKGIITSSEAGLAISSAMSLTGILQYGISTSVDLENKMISVERVIEYSQTPSEAPLELKEDEKPNSSWPINGSIRFENMSLRYNQVDQSVLKNINCIIQPKEKIGIVGRTGAGKSSLITALFRLVEPDGRILIDDIDTKSIGLHELRSKISIIPQDPVLFSGSLRKNLDPFGEYDDQTLWNALEDVKLKELLTDLQTGLDYAITEGGSNLSVGERQLVCLARAILRQNKVLVLDEATANVDQKTDSLIQLTIREKFKDCTVLTIAHRLNTIMDSDRVMVMDAGCLMEFEEPVVLLQNSESLFRLLVDQTGIECASELIDLAHQARFFKE